MKGRTRLFVFVASAVLLAGIGTAGVASYFGLESIGLSASSASDELSYVPATAPLVAYVDVRHVMDSDLRHRLQPDASSPDQPSQFLEQTGINVETDLDSVVMVGLAAQSTQSAPPLILASGRFDPSRIEASIRAHGGTVAEHGGVKVATLENEQLAVGFIKTGLLAVGKPADVFVAIETGASGGPTIKDNADVQSLMSRVDSHDAWTVARMDAVGSLSRVPPDLARQLPSITWLAAGGDVNDGVSAVLHAVARDERAAQDLREVIRGFLALVRMQAGQQPEFAEFMNSVELSGEGTTVSLGFSMPSTLIDRLRALKPPQPAAAGAAPVRFRRAPSI